MSFARRNADGSIEHVPAAVDAQGRTIPVGFDALEGVQKVAMMVWDPDTLQWVRGAGSTGGGSGGGGESTPKTKRIDRVSDALMYIGKAEFGTAETSVGWLVEKISFDTDGNVTAVRIASGIWTDRNSLTYG